jgi:hypothetical protein
MYGWYAEGSHFVGRCERMTDDLVQALRGAGEEVDATAIAQVGRVNESEKRLGDPVWDPAVLEQVVEVEAEGIRRWGYEDEVAATCRAHGVRRVV